MRLELFLDLYNLSNVAKQLLAQAVALQPGDHIVTVVERRDQVALPDVRRIHFQLVGEVIDHLEHERLLRAVQRPGTLPQGVVFV